MKAGRADVRPVFFCRDEAKPKAARAGESHPRAAVPHG